MAVVSSATLLKTPRRMLKGQLGAIFAPRPFGRQIGHDGVETDLRLVLIEKDQVVEYAHHRHFALDGRQLEHRHVGRAAGVRQLQKAAVLLGQSGVTCD